ncbi:MAG: bifunctional UDP-N-acetylmuramoyl-tripeptide:D-alanyl-D-alanine ligase/alanine racemase [Bacteroidales bacterium]|nr:MAG: bifunctional UDP-N-acetylmuramoyl-tripeptide:D-alanyl-D-alanine ligase/alanine racemase [Bacteroidales bacterium]
MIEISVKDISKLTGGELIGSGNRKIRQLLIDSRKHITSEGTLFIALAGDRNDGHRFIRDLFRKGIRIFMVDHPPDEIEKFTDATFILVHNTLDSLQQLAGYVRNRYKNPLISITGSNGKTVIKEWLSQMLGVDKKVVRSPRSFNSQVGVPLSLWLLDNEFDYAIIEAGISFPGEMEKLRKIIRPDIGIFSNIGEAHQENFSSIADKVREKLNLFRDSGALIYCYDHMEIRTAILSDPGIAGKSFFTWSENSNADLRIKSVVRKEERTTIEGIYADETIRIRIPFTDDASVENAIQTWCLLLYLGYTPGVIRQRMEKLEPVAMRLEMKKGINRCTIINDSYNSDLGSLQIAVDLLFSQKQHNKRTMILSDILQSGRDEKELYSEVADLVSRRGLDRIIGIGESISRFADLFPMNKEFYHSTGEFLSHLQKDMFSGEAVLLKGARIFEFEKILQSLEQQIHQTQLEINLDALIHNLNFFRSKLHPSTRVMVMVKAFSYGSGSYEIASAMQFQRVDYLAVAFADEGVMLREAGINLPIMVMNPEVKSLDLLIRYDLEPEIYDFNILKRFSEVVRRSGMMNYPVHIKLDTGMNRLGFVAGEKERLLEVLKTHRELFVKSVFSHLAASDDKKHDHFTRHQIDLFTTISDKLIAMYNHHVLRHILNSSGIERFPEAQFDMVRLGIGLYGISDRNRDQVRNISSLKSRISQIKSVKAGDSIGYGRDARVSGETRIAVIPVGYADGLNRKFGNGVGQFIINDKPVPVIGNICMDMCMVNITGVDAKTGDEVEIFGERNRISDLAEKIDTIPYEILAGISQRVKRVYFQE